MSPQTQLRILVAGGLENATTPRPFSVPRGEWAFPLPPQTPLWPPVFGHPPHLTRPLDPPPPDTAICSPKIHTNHTALSSYNLHTAFRNVPLAYARVSHAHPSSDVPPTRVPSSSPAWSATSVAMPLFGLNTTPTSGWLALARLLFPPRPFFFSTDCAGSASIALPSILRLSLDTESPSRTSYPHSPPGFHAANRSHRYCCIHNIFFFSGPPGAVENTLRPLALLDLPRLLPPMPGPANTPMATTTTQPAHCAFFMPSLVPRPLTLVSARFAFPSRPRPLTAPPGLPHLASAPSPCHQHSHVYLQHATPTRFARTLLSGWGIPQRVFFFHGSRLGCLCVSLAHLPHPVFHALPRCPGDVVGQPCNAWMWNALSSRARGSSHAHHAGVRLTTPPPPLRHHYAPLLFGRVLPRRCSLCPRSARNVFFFLVQFHPDLFFFWFFV